MKHGSFLLWSRCFIVACRMNMEQRLQHKLLLQTLNNLCSSLRGCQRLAADGGEGDRHRQHHVTR